MQHTQEEGGHRIPLFLNAQAGTAQKVVQAASSDARFAVHECDADALMDVIEEELEQHAPPRIAVAGGDGTIAAAANVLVGTDTELGIVPGGTLNHFSKRYGIPTVLEDALDLAASGRGRGVTVGSVNNRVFLNTSSVGAYVGFVQVRDMLEQWMGYYLATLVAGLRTVLRMPLYVVDLEVEDRRRRSHTPLAFIGVGEHRLQFPSFGEPVDESDAALHMLVMHGRRRARFFALALTAAAYGLPYAAQAPEMDSLLVDQCTIELPWDRALVALDGEIVPFETPLRYQIQRQALKIVVPPTTSQ